ncbi:MAG: ABC transporter ATP-binding protein, partial [Sphingobacteriales bacterium]
MQPLLSVRNLTIRFATEVGPVTAVQGVSFDVQPGEVVGIVGESGSGKSVSTLSLMRLLASPPALPAEGEAIFQSKQFGELNLLRAETGTIRSIRGKEIGMIFQEPMTSLNPVYTCGKQVAEVLLLHTNLSKKAAKQRVIELFNEVELPRPEQIYDSYPHEISGGQKQRVMIAMATACNPQILIADEPTTALDVTVQARVLKLMDKMRQQHQMAMLFITHDLGVVAEIAHRVVVMYKGQIVEQGPVEQVFHHPQHPYTKGLLACRPTLNTPKGPLLTVADFMSAAGEVISPEKDRLQEAKNSASAPNFAPQLPSEKPLIIVDNLQVHFPVRTGFFGRTSQWVKAVDGVSFDIKQGETVGLVGESGCGKTTLGRTLLRLVEPTGGNIIFDGQELKKIPAEELRKMRQAFQLIFQDPYASLNPRHTIGQSILEPMQVHGQLASNKERRERVYELLETVGLQAAHYHRYPHEFSGGQRQRISIARALGLNPRFLICDESVS